ncbi:MAG: nuclear transport factor 2 family protein [Wenzhouxiangella sp.]|nr:MAG: nuclear transport factor 2 family protein [Wenzhouxiangella sp.]
MRLWLTLVPVLVLVACTRPADEDRIRQHLDAMIDALADQNARAFMAPLADDFSADTWNLDRRGARLLLNREMRAHQRIRVRLFDIQVDLVTDDRASASFQAVLTGGSGLIPEQGSWYRVSTGWRRQGSDWELITASWERVAGR